MPNTFKEHFQSAPHTWTAESLSGLKLAELQGLAEIAGMPCQGTKAQLATRLLKWIRVRVVVGRWGDNVQAIAALYDMKTLRHYMDIAGTWKAPSKPQAVATLLNWRNQARKKGQQNLALGRQQAREAADKRPQLSLFGKGATHE